MKTDINALIDRYTSQPLELYEGADDLHCEVFEAARGREGDLLARYIASCAVRHWADEVAPY